MNFVIAPLLGKNKYSAWHVPTIEKLIQEQFFSPIVFGFFSGKSFKRCLSSSKKVCKPFFKRSINFFFKRLTHAQKCDYQSCKSILEVKEEENISHYRAITLICALTNYPIQEVNSRHLLISHK